MIKAIHLDIVLNPFQKSKFYKKKSFYKSISNKNTFSKPPYINIFYVYEDLIGGLGSTRAKKQVPCFYHDDAKPSMTLYLDTNTFFCFTCRKWGGPYDIIMHIKGMTFPQALKFGESYL